MCVVPVHCYIEGITDIQSDNRGRLTICVAGECTSIDDTRIVAIVMIPTLSNRSNRCVTECVLPLNKQ